MIFGISDIDLMDKNKIKILNGIAGSGKSTTAVNELRRLGSNFCLASFSNALKFAASDKFGCPTDTICGLEFINSPVPRSAFKDVTEYDTVVNDEILLDGVDCINWMKANVGKINIIALTDSRQMLTVEGGPDVLSAFKSLCNMKSTIVVDISDTKRAVNKKTKDLYNKLYAADSSQLYTIEAARDILGCDVVESYNIDYNEEDTYICHSNKIEHDLYKRYKLSDRYDIKLIPKNHIARNRHFDPHKYPICDQMTAMDKHLNSFLEAANVASPVRFQGKEVEVGTNCYYFVQEGDIISGRELYTVATRCKDIDSLHMVIINVEEMKDPQSIQGISVVKAKHLRIMTNDLQCRGLSPSHMLDVIKKMGDAGQAYKTDYVVCGDHIVYASVPLSTLQKFAVVKDNEVKIVKHKSSGGKTSIQSIVKKDSSMHFDYMEKVYTILNTPIVAPSICNHYNRTRFSKLCDIYSAFPTILKYTELPKAGELYTSYDPELLNYYVYKGDVVTKGSLITEPLAKKLGNSEYVFSTVKQTGCMLGEYTYSQSFISKEKKKKINKDFLWGILKRNYYSREMVAIDGSMRPAYVKDKKNNLQLLDCALWSNLCLVMLNAIDSLGIYEYYVMTDGLYYNSDKEPVLPEWCDYRICELNWNKKDKKEKYENIIKQTYEDLPTDRQLRYKKEKENAKT